MAFLCEFFNIWWVEKSLFLLLLNCNVSAFHLKKLFNLPINFSYLYLSPTSIHITLLQFIASLQHFREWKPSKIKGLIWHIFLNESQILLQDRLSIFEITCFGESPYPGNKVVVLSQTTQNNDSRIRTNCKLSHIGLLKSSLCDDFIDITVREIIRMKLIIL